MFLGRPLQVGFSLGGSGTWRGYPSKLKGVRLALAHEFLVDLALLNDLAPESAVHVPLEILDAVLDERVGKISKPLFSGKLRQLQVFDFLVDFFVEHAQQRVSAFEDPLLSVLVSNLDFVEHPIFPGHCVLDDLEGGVVRNQRLPSNFGFLLHARQRGIARGNLELKRVFVVRCRYARQQRRGELRIALRDLRCRLGYS